MLVLKTAHKKAVVEKSCCCATVEKEASQRTREKVGNREILVGGFNRTRHPDGETEWVDSSVPEETPGDAIQNADTDPKLSVTIYKRSDDP